MDTTKDYDFLILKNAKFQVLINLLINGIVVVLAMGKLEYVPIFDVGGIAQDLLITNIFLIFFLFLFGKIEMEKWRKGNNKTGVWYSEVKHKNIAKYLKRSFAKNYFFLFVKYSLTYTLALLSHAPLFMVTWQQSRCFIFY